MAINWMLPGKTGQMAHVVVRAGSTLLVTACGVALNAQTAQKARKTSSHCWVCEEKIAEQAKAAKEAQSV